MKTIILIFTMILTSSMAAQGGSLSITHLEKQKERVIKENKRIRVTTNSGDKFQGRFTILDENTIALDGITMQLHNIERIKRHPLFNTIFIKTNFIHIGALGLFFGVLGTSLSSSTDENGSVEYTPMAAGVVLLGAGIYGAVKSPNINKGYSADKKWEFKINVGSNENVLEKE